MITTERHLQLSAIEARLEASLGPVVRMVFPEAGEAVMTPEAARLIAIRLVEEAAKAEQAEEEAKRGMTAGDPRHQVHTPSGWMDYQLSMRDRPDLVAEMMVGAPAWMPEPLAPCEPPVAGARYVGTIADVHQWVCEGPEIQGVGVADEAIRSRHAGVARAAADDRGGAL